MPAGSAVRGAGQRGKAGSAGGARSALRKRGSDVPRAAGGARRGVWETRPLPIAAPGTRRGAARPRRVPRHLRGGGGGRYVGISSVRTYARAGGKHRIVRGGGIGAEWKEGVIFGATCAVALYRPRCYAGAAARGQADVGVVAATGSQPPGPQKKKARPAGALSGPGVPRVRGFRSPLRARCLTHPLPSIITRTVRQSGTTSSIRWGTEAEP